MTAARMRASPTMVGQHTSHVAPVDVRTGGRMSTEEPDTHAAPPGVAPAAAGNDAMRRYDAAALREYASGLLVRIGVRDDIAGDVAAILVDGDLMGHTTHGLALLADYLDQLTQGRMAKSGAPAIVHSAT